MRSTNAKDHVLIVDDMPIYSAVLSSILESEGYTVTCASNGASAIHTAKNLQPQLILLDVKMPGMDGYEVCKALKADDATQDIPIIFVTGADDSEEETLGFALGAADYIAKPIKRAALLARVRAHVRLYRQHTHLVGMFHDVMEFAPDAFILASMDGTIERVNAQAEALFGYPRSELLGKSVETLIPTYWNHHPTMGSQDLHTHLRSAALPCVRKDSSRFPADISLGLLATQGSRLTMAVVRDVSERQRVEWELSQSRQQLRALAAQNEATREGERKHIAREVHDELGQVLTAMRMDLSLLERRFSKKVPDLAEHTRNMKALVDRAIQGVRNVATNLRPSVLDLGLVSALDWLCNEFADHTATICTLHANKQDTTLEESRAVVVFRIAQESLTNISRYAQARRVDMALTHRDHDLVLEVRDDGQGFDLEVESQKKSFGLLGMRERAIALGGHLHIDSAVGQGTVIRLSIPLSIDPTGDSE